jgi:hypothetical protein
MVSATRSAMVVLPHPETPMMTMKMGDMKLLGPGGSRHGDCAPDHGFLKGPVTDS